MIWLKNIQKIQPMIINRQNIMKKETVASTIKRLTKKHLLENNGLLFGQCITALGWINDTVPELKHGIVELPISDVSNGGIAVGAALAGRRPIYVIRFQGLGWYNLTTVLNYAAKSKEMWGVSCPIFVRSINVEGHIGPVASNSHHGLCCRMPGIVVKAPMTPNEWEDVWLDFLENDDPVYCSEHRRSFDIDYEMEDDVSINYYLYDCVIYAIGNSRLNALEAQKILRQQDIRTAIFHLVDIKPFINTLEYKRALNQCGKGLVIDSDFQNYGVATQIAYDMMIKSNYPVYTLGLEDRTAGFASHCDNLTPSVNRIVERIKEIINI